MYRIGDYALIYGFLFVFLAVGVLFLLQFYFFAKGFCKKCIWL